MNHFPFIIFSSTQPIKNKWFLELMETFVGTILRLFEKSEHSTDILVLLYWPKLFSFNLFTCKRSKTQDFKLKNFSGCYWYTNNIADNQNVNKIKHNPRWGEENIFSIVGLSSKYLRVTRLNTLTKLLEFHSVRKTFQLAFLNLLCRNLIKFYSSSII